MKAPANFLLEIADAVKVETNAATRFAMSAVLGELSIAIKAVVEFPNDDTLRHLQSQWSHAKKLLEFSKPAAPPPVPLPDAVTAELQKMAA